MKRKLIRTLTSIALVAVSASHAGAQLSDIQSGLPEYMRLRVHTKDEIVACREIDGLTEFFAVALQAVRSGQHISWPAMLADHRCALLRPGDGVIVLGITPDGEAVEEVIERGQFELDSDTYDLLKVEIVPNADLNTDYFLVDGDLVQISGEGTMWVLIDYLEKYAAYW